AGGGWFLASLDGLARAAGVAYETAQKAVAGLRRCSLVATRRSYVIRETPERLVARADRNWYYSPTVSEGETMMFPMLQWTALVARVSHAPTLAARLSLRSCLPPLGTPPRPHPVSARNQTYVSLCSLSLRSRRSDNEVIDAGAPRPASADAFLPDLSVEAETQTDRDLRALLNGRGLPRPDFSTGYVHRPLPVNPLENEPAQVGWIPAHALPQHKARLVAEGFRDACREVYGRDPYSFASFDWDAARALDKPDVRPAQLPAKEGKQLATYRRFLACAVEMSDHAVPPKHWAIWRLRWVREHNPKFKDAPPPIFMIMAASAVVKRAGWFRKDYNLSDLYPRAKKDPVRFEQHLRNFEAGRLERGRVSPRLALDGPDWYVEMRKREIAQGITDPMVRFPRPAKRRVA
ncbi:MAG TPA: hypothetical protein VES97_11755, partial [Solirubrobacteraceae bacterium]|nr:hypothetical protein [Solirubrobacteraceae bacterium]